MSDVTFEINLLNLHYTLRGFDSIRELKEWLDEHASEGWEQPSLVPTIPTPGANRASE